MSSQGPSKEDLEMYWKTSRQYFDELANYYKTADPAYYDQYITPFYSNPLYAAGGKSSGSSRAIIFIVALVFIVIGIAAVGIFVFLSTESDNSSGQEKPKIEKKIGKEIDIPKIDSIKTETPVDLPKNTNRKKSTR